MNTTASSARSRSASSNTITGFLPPSSKCTRFKVGAPCAMIADPVALSPTKPIALIAGCSVKALPASSPKPCTVLSTPSGIPASFTSLASRSAVTGDHSAGLCTTVQPAASAGAIFQVESMNGVFHGVITPTGPIGTRVEIFQCSSLGVLRPSRASPHLSAKKRKFSAARIAALAMKRCACPVSMHSSTAISSARSSIASATRCSSFLRIAAGMSRQGLKASAAAVAARSISSALPRATDASTLPSTGEVVSNVWPETDGTILPSMMWPMPSDFSFANSGVTRSRLAAKTSDDFGVTLSMDSGPHFQSFVDVVAFPAHVLVVDLHLEREREGAFGEHRIEIGRQRLEDVLAGLLAGREIAALAEPQQHGDEAVIGVAVGNRKMLAAHGADAGAADRENSGFDRGLADHLAHLAHVDAGIQVGGIFEREMRHVFLAGSRMLPTIAATEARSLSHPTRVYPSWASISIEVGYIRLQWERVGVRGYALSTGLNPSPGSQERSDLSLWERCQRSHGPMQFSSITFSGEVAAHAAIGTIVGLNRVAFAGLDRADERAGEHDLAGLQRKPERRDLVGEPRHAGGGMVEHAGGKPGLFELAVAIAQRADPAQVGIHWTDRTSAQHDAGVRRVVGNRIKNLAGRFCLGIDALDAGVEDFQRRHDKIRRVEHVE